MIAPSALYRAWQLKRAKTQDRKRARTPQRTKYLWAKAVYEEDEKTPVIEG